MNDQFANRQETREEYRFQRIIDAQYKSDFYDSIYQVPTRSHLAHSRVGNGLELQDSMYQENRVENPKQFYATIYGCSYGKAKFSHL